ncbi:MAG: hypothetical protein WBY94_12630 [Polyangiaceae bacterium]
MRETRTLTSVSAAFLMLLTRAASGQQDAGPAASNPDGGAPTSGPSTPNPDGGSPASAPSAPSPEPAPRVVPVTGLPREVPLTELPREDVVEAALAPNAFTSKTAFGGYGELTLNSLGTQGAQNLQNRGAANQFTAAPSNVVDLRRVVFFFGHEFSDQFRFYSEVEFEHAVTSIGDQGEAEIEQAFLDWLPSKRVNVRAGLILWPMGIINIYHEPPSFFGVDRPDVDTVVIPTTWREAGFGVFGALSEDLRYQLYVGTSFDAHGFDAQYGLRDGHQEAQLAYAGDGSAIARIDYEPLLGTVFGASACGGTSGNTLASTVGRVPFGLFDVDARMHRGGLTARLEIAAMVLGDAGALDRALLAAWPGPAPWNGPVPSASWGGYAEIGYDLLRLAAPGTSQELHIFDRFDAVDTQASVPAGFTAVREDRRYSDMIGLVYKPIPQIALKSDYRRQQLGTGTGYNEFDAAITWLF